MDTQKKTPPIAFFAAQFKDLLVGVEGGFETFGDLCKFAAQECGITGVSLPTGMLDVNRMIRDGEHRAEVEAEYVGYGTKIISLESHVVGQRVCMHPAVRERFVRFAPAAYQHVSTEGLEVQASREMMQAIELSRLLGFKHHQTFPGGRSNPVLTDPWPAHAAQLHEKSLALLAIKWEPILAAAGRAGIKVGFEIRHIMEDLFDVETLIDFRDRFLQNPDAKEAAGWGIDLSHHEIDGDNPAHDVALAITADLVRQGHAKQGDYDESIPGGNRRPANKAWIKRPGKFATFGTVNPQNSRLWCDAIQGSFDKDPNVFATIEGECMFLRNPKQGLRVAADNLRAVFAGKDPTLLAEITPDPWDGPAFDRFADSGYTFEAAAQLDAETIRALHERMEAVGIPRT